MADAVTQSDAADIQDHRHAEDNLLKAAVEIRIFLLVAVAVSAASAIPLV